MSAGEAIRVVVRVRPASAGELARGGGACVRVAGGGAVEATAGALRRTFRFSAALPPATSQAGVFAQTAQPLVARFLDGFNVCVLAYGQTAAGKTYTMMGKSFSAVADGGDADARTAGAERELVGVIPRVVGELFDVLEREQTDTVDFELRASFVELYREQVFDLLVPDVKAQLRMRDNGTMVFFPDARSELIGSADDVLALLARGNRNRAVAATRANRDSSRGHALFLLSLRRTDRAAFRTVESQLYLVDLAGSEKVKKTGVSGVQLKEAAAINRSLLALGNVIFALSENAAARAKGQKPPVHVSFRDSKLTRILKAPLSNAMTVLLCCVSPSDVNAQETLSTLRFGDRSQQISARVERNTSRTLDDYKNLLLASEARVAELERLLDALTTGGATKEKQKNNDVDEGVDNNSNVDDDDDDDDGDDDGVSGGKSKLKRSQSWSDLTAFGDPTNDSDDETVATAVPTAAVRAPAATVVASAGPGDDLFHFVCPLTRLIFREPVVAADGVTYERDAIEAHIARGRRGGGTPLSPVTGEPLASGALHRNLLCLAQVRLRFQSLAGGVTIEHILPFDWVFQDHIVEDIALFLGTARCVLVFRSLSRRLRDTVDRPSVVRRLAARLLRGETPPRYSNTLLHAWFLRRLRERARKSGKGKRALEYGLKLLPR